MVRMVSTRPIIQQSRPASQNALAYNMPGLGLKRGNIRSGLDTISLDILRHHKRIHGGDLYDM